MTSRLALAALLALAACGTPGRAERIGTQPDGGSLMLSANNDKAWDQAREIMSNHCDGKYRVVGQSQAQGRGSAGPPPATPGAMADPLGAAGAPYGLRVDYECTGVGGPLPPPPVPLVEPPPAVPPAAAKAS